VQEGWFKPTLKKKNDNSLTPIAITKSYLTHERRNTIMRKIIVYDIVSLDGYHTGLNNNVEVMFPMMGDKVFNAYTAERLREADAFLVGRVSFQLFNNFWPDVAKNLDSDKYTEGEKEISRAGQGVSTTIVVSDTLNINWPDVRIIRRANVYEEIAELKRQPGKDILMTGSRTLWNDLLAHDLIDEIHLMIGNLVLGEGIPVFAGKVDAPLKLIDVRTWEDSDHILARYKVLHKDS
jgi:dihydrofolate reductase